EQVLANWQAIKTEEKGGGAPESALDGVPASLPALLLAMDISKKAAKLGFEWPDVNSVMDKMREEVEELEVELSGASKRDHDRIADEIGDLLFTVVNVARWARVDPEEALRRMVRRFSARFKDMEGRVKANGGDVGALTAEEWDEHWNLAKENERQA
ncbi:MAG: MazG nucleotide pyrophosphohydrolase domain-containing protein, partial [Armatimonadota bacterium]